MEPNLGPCPPLEELSDLELCYIAACELGKYFLPKAILIAVAFHLHRIRQCWLAVNELGISLAYGIDVFKASKTTGKARLVLSWPRQQKRQSCFGR